VPSWPQRRTTTVLHITRLADYTAAYETRSTAPGRNVRWTRQTATNTSNIGRDPPCSIQWNIIQELLCTAGA